MASMVRLNHLPGWTLTLFRSSRLVTVPPTFFRMWIHPSEVSETEYHSMPSELVGLKRGYRVAWSLPVPFHDWTRRFAAMVTSPYDWLFIELFHAPVVPLPSAR